MTVPPFALRAGFDAQDVHPGSDPIVPVRSVFEPASRSWTKIRRVRNSGNDVRGETAEGDEPPITT